PPAHEEPQPVRSPDQRRQVRALRPVRPYGFAIGRGKLPQRAERGKSFSRYGARMKVLHKLKHISVALASIAALAGCSGSEEKPVLQYMPHMATTPNLKPQRGYEPTG